MNFISEINQLWSLIGVGQTMRSLIQQAMSGASLVAMAKSALSQSNIDALEAVAEQLFPKLAPELRLAAAVVAAYDHDKTKWLQQSLNIVLKLTGEPDELTVDGIYGPATVAAVEKFQTDITGLKVDGFAFKATTPLIEAALAKLLSRSPTVTAVVTQQQAVLEPAQVS